MSISVLKEEIKNNKIRNLYLFYGDEEYLKKTYLGKIEDKILDRQTADFNKIIFEGKTDLGKLIDACETMPMLSEKKLVVVKDSGFFKSRKKEDGTKKDSKNGHQGSLSELISSVPGHTCLIFYESEVGGRLKLIEEINKKGLVVNFTRQKPQDLVNWTILTMNTMGKKLEPNAASLLVDFSDLDMSGLMNEMSKLAAYVGEKERISIADVKAVCARSLKSRVFDLTDAIADSNAPDALKILDELIALKEPIPKILYMIARQMRQLLEMKLLLNEGKRDGEAASALGVSPYIAGRIARQSGKFNLKVLEKALETCLEMDIAIKSGKLEDKAAAEILISIFAK